MSLREELSRPEGGWCGERKFSLLLDLSSEVSSVVDGSHWASSKRYSSGFEHSEASLQELLPLREEFAAPMV